MFGSIKLKKKNCSRRPVPCHFIIEISWNCQFSYYLKHLYKFCGLRVLSFPTTPRYVYIRIFTVSSCLNQMFVVLVSPGFILQILEVILLLAEEHVYNLSLASIYIRHGSAEMSLYKFLFFKLWDNVLMSCNFVRYMKF